MVGEVSDDENVSVTNREEVIGYWRILYSK
jgi:hypothetical protein